ncbi:MAG: aminotransferase class I/II-fold pyridoxal phosphate-dependent enzyme [Microscillaceae bacterium]|nr:aminotransferase class I/II-fold pyridoxal phosphate-dependent enzyme [Microscillaceae bacterium]
MRVDLRSDTLTKPTPAMLQAMMQAEVGDDVYGEDPTVYQLEQTLAKMFGKEAALFCPSGTMTNQIAIRILTQPQDEVICHKTAHIYKYEGGGTFANSLVSMRLLDGAYGKIKPESIIDNINPNDIHFPATRVVALENTANRGGGSIYTLSEIAEIAKICQTYDLSLHLDGARIFNALVETQENPREYGKYFDTISVCLSKGLGCPIGSVLIASEALIQKARRVRKAFGGAMRQAGYLAAAGLYALENHIDRLKEDHRRARAIGEALQNFEFLREVYPVQTNIVIACFTNEVITKQMFDYLQENNIHVGLIDKKQLRFVTHLDFTDEHLDKLLAVLAHFE